MGRGLIGALTLGLACMPASTERPDDGSRTERTEPDEPVEPDGPVLVMRDGGPALLLADVVLASGPGHVTTFGWTPDGARFGYCHDRPGCLECRLSAQDGSAESIESGPECSEGVERSVLDARLASESLGPGSTRWSWGEQVSLVVESREEEITNAGQPRPMLKVGARAGAEGPPVWMLHVDPCQGCGIDQVCSKAAHLDALTLSPDGRELIALVHEQGDEGSESLRLERLMTDRLAQAALMPASQSRP